MNHRCEELGYRFNRRDLDNVYRRFVELADQIKVVEDPQLIRLIREEIALGVMPDLVKPTRAAGASAHAATS